MARSECVLIVGQWFPVLGELYTFFGSQCLYSRDVSTLCWSLVIKLWTLPIWLSSNPLQHVVGNGWQERRRPTAAGVADMRDNMQPVTYVNFRYNYTSAHQSQWSKFIHVLMTRTRAEPLEPLTYHKYILTAQQTFENNWWLCGWQQRCFMCLLPFH